MPTLPRTLRILFCENNQLRRLPGLPDGLQELQCGNNELTEIPALPDSLSSLRCGGNEIKTMVNFPPDCYVDGLDIEFLDLRTLKLYKTYINNLNEGAEQGLLMLTSIDRRIDMLTRRSTSGRRNASGSVKKTGVKKRRKSVRKQGSKKKRVSKKSVKKY